jgi:hypothetical protein
VRCSISMMMSSHPINYMRSYLITELMGTDLKTLLDSRPIENEFVQYFLYQIMVSVITNARMIYY